jgi:hypothetical protein
MTAVVSARDILPSLYDDENGREDVVDDLKYDLRNLTACNYHEIRSTDDDEEREDMIFEAATRATQLLVKRLVSLYPF